jgi:glycosyltransferase involved in cell wall biosynthesis
MKSNQSIAVIIPTLNEFENIQVLIPALLSCNNSNHISIYIVDSPRSKDGLGAYVKTLNLPEISYLISEKGGRSYQLNCGAMHSEEEVLMFLHADVLPPIGYNDLIIDALEEHEAGFFSYNFNPSNFWLNINSFFTSFDGVFSGGGDQIHFIKRNIFNRLGGYDESYHLMEDFEFFERWKKNNVPYTIIQKRASVSSRKYCNNSWLRVNLINLYIFTLYKLKTHPERLKKKYTSLIRN